MKKIVYLAPLALLGVGVKASANQVPTHISNALRIYEQENMQSQPVGQSENEQGTKQAEPSLPNSRNQPVGKEATHISRLDSGLINGDSSVVNGQASQVIKISRTAIPTKQELNESKDSVAGQYVQVQQNRVAQFNNGSKIYGLNNSSQLSKNTGDGYVITNAGMYNGRAVDIGVTINKVQDNQGSYTTKWSNGDKADVTGKVDNQFNYQNSALIGTTSQQPQVDASRTRTRTETKDVTTKLEGWWVIDTDYHTWSLGSHASEGEKGASGQVVIAPDLIKQIMEKTHCTYDTALFKLGIDTSKMIKTHMPMATMYENGVSDKAYIDQYYVGPITPYHSGDPDYLFKRRTTIYHVMFTDKVNDKNLFDSDDWLRFPTEKIPAAADGSNDRIGGSYDTIDLEIPDKAFDPNWGIDTNGRWTNNFNDIEYYFEDDAGLEEFAKYRNLLRKGVYTRNWRGDPVPTDETKKYLSLEPTNVITKKDVQVTDHLQLNQVNNGSLNYDYTIGVYDAQTGELIKDLTANYKGKTGKTATDQDTVMNDAVKAKIQAINANQANSAYTGTAANDDIVFNKNTVHVNYVDTRGESINVPGYDIDVDNLTSGNYQVPQNYTLVNPNGFKVTKNTHEVNGVTVTDSYNFIDQGHNKVTDNGKTLSVVLAHGTTHVDASHSGLSNNATANTFVINNGAKRQINSQSRRFNASGILDLVTNKVSMQGDWQLSGKSNFDQTNVNNDLVGYGNAIHSNLTFLTL